MRIRELAFGVVLGIAVSGQAMPQQADAPDALSEAERNAARRALTEAENQLNAGERGSDSEPCKLMASYFLHIVKAAAAAGARTRIADWPDLSWQEQDAVMQTIKGNYERNKRLRTTACMAAR